MSVITALYVGYRFRDAEDRLKKLEHSVKTKAEKPKPVKTVSESILDPLDEVQQAKWEYEEKMRKMNNGPM